jgi:hypothetical protein
MTLKGTQFHIEPNTQKPAAKRKSGISSAPGNMTDPWIRAKTKSLLAVWSRKLTPAACAPSWPHLFVRPGPCQNHPPLTAPRRAVAPPGKAKSCLCTDATSARVFYIAMLSCSSIGHLWRGTSTEEQTQKAVNSNANLRHCKRARNLVGTPQRQCPSFPADLRGADGLTTKVGARCRTRHSCRELATWAALGHKRQNPEVPYGGGPD